MANSNAPFGFRLANETSIGASKMCYTSDSTPLGKGDLVILSGTGGSANGGPTRPAVTRITAGAGNAIYGVVTGCFQEWATSSFSLERTHKPASVAMYVEVYPLRAGDELIVQGNTGVDVTAIGSTCNVGTITDCNSTTGFSTMYADTGTLHTSANSTDQLRVMGYEDVNSNVKNSAYNRIKVVVNNLQVANVTAAF